MNKDIMVKPFGHDLLHELAGALKETDRAVCLGEAVVGAAGLVEDDNGALVLWVGAAVECRIEDVREGVQPGGMGPSEDCVADPTGARCGIVGRGFEGHSDLSGGDGCLWCSWGMGFGLGALLANCLPCRACGGRSLYVGEFQWWQALDGDGLGGSVPKDCRRLSGFAQGCYQLPHGRGPQADEGRDVSSPICCRVTSHSLDLLVGGAVEVVMFTFCVFAVHVLVLFGIM